MRYLVTAYYSEWVEATSEEAAEDVLASVVAGLDNGAFTYEVHDSEEAAR